MIFGIRRITHALLVALIVLSPWGTRVIIDVAHVAGVPVESATHSVFMTQLIVIALAAAAFWGSRGRLGPFAFPERAAILLLLLSATSAALSHDPYRASALTVRLMFGVLLFIAASRVSVPVRTVAWALLATAAIQGGAALFQVHSQSVIADTPMGVASQLPSDLGTSVIETDEGRLLRAYGTLPHPNILGLVTAIGTIAGAWLTVELSVAYLAVMLLCLSSFAMMLSFSRAALIAFIPGVAAYALQARRHAALRPKYLVAALVIALTAIGAIAAMPEAWVTRVSTGGRLETISVDARMQSLRDGAELIAAAPVLGVGPGLSQQAIAILHPDRDGWSLEPPHMVPVAIAAEAGIPAALAWVVFVASLLMTAIRAFNRSAMVPLVALLLVVVAASFFDHYFWTIWPGQLVFWLVCGLFWAGARKSYAPSDAAPASESEAAAR